VVPVSVNISELISSEFNKDWGGIVPDRAVELLQ